MPKKDLVSTSETIADDLSSVEIKDHLASTLQHALAAEALWPGLVSLPAGDRSGNLGKLVAQLSTPLQHLFTALTPRDGEDQKTQQKKAELGKVFNSMLGGQDRGKDDSRFEVELLIRRLERIEAQAKIVEALDRLRTRFADDSLNTGEMVVEPGLHALEVARTAAATNPEFRSLLAPVIDSLGDMTKKARQHQEAARKKAAEAAASAGGEDK